MINCRIIIRNDCGIGEDSSDYYLEVKLPALPFIGMRIEVDVTPLEDRIKKNFEVAKCFFPDWFYGKSKAYEEKEHLIIEDLENFSIQDAAYVCAIYMKANCDYVEIVLCDGSDMPSMFK